MPSIQSFPPISTPDSEVLILGSMPGAMSLAAAQYYAHPRNLFWKIIADLLQFNPATSYADRINALHNAKIALWDVIHTCSRDGSLDSAIENELPNDFQTFFKIHPKIRLIFFNGGKAENSFHRYVVNKIDLSKLTLIRLPSTSPANQTIRYEDKLIQWRQIIAKI